MNDKLKLWGTILVLSIAMFSLGAVAETILDPGIQEQGAAAQVEVKAKNDPLVTSGTYSLTLNAEQATLLANKLNAKGVTLQEDIVLTYETAAKEEVTRQKKATLQNEYERFYTTATDTELDEAYNWFATKNAAKQQ